MQSTIANPSQSDIISQAKRRQLISFAKALDHRYDGLFDLEQFLSNRSEETLVLQIRRAVVRIDLLLVRRRLLLLPSQSLALLRLNLDFVCAFIHSGGRTDGYSWTCRCQPQLEQRRRRQQVDGITFLRKSCFSTAAAPAQRSLLRHRPSLHRHDDDNKSLLRHGSSVHRGSHRRSCCLLLSVNNEEDNNKESQDFHTERKARWFSYLMILRSRKKTNYEPTNIIFVSLPLLDLRISQKSF